MGSSSDAGFVSTVGDKQSLSVGMESMAKRPRTVVLEEKTDIYQPTEEELLEYARWLGMNIPQDMDLIWIARDGLTRPLPEEWKPCQTEDDEIYYFNFETGESVWDHPCDGLSRKLYQEECMRLGKRPCQLVESASCSSHLQQLSNWGDESTHTQPPRQAYFDEMVNEKEMHSPEGSFCQALSPQESMHAERLPSSKEIQMNIVEKEIDAMKDIRAQLLQKMSALWQEEEYRPLTSQMTLEGVANYNEPQQGSMSLLEGNIYRHPSAEVGNFMELQPQKIGQDWSDGQHEEEMEDPRTTKERTELLRTQLEIAKIVKLQIPNKIGVANVYNVRKPYKDQIHESESSSRPPILYALEVSQEANSETNENKFSLDGVDVPPRITAEELKKANLAVSDRMKEKLLFQLSNIDGMERSTFEDEYQLALSRKKEKMELLRKELRKDMEFQLLLEEESILKRKREEMLARLRNQIEGEGFAEQGNFYGVSPHLHSVSKGYEHKSEADEDSKELFMQWTKELKDEVICLKTKMNEILVLHANTNQEQLESPPVLPVTSEDICKASSDIVPIKKNSTEFIYTLRKILGEFDVNLKHLLKNQGIGLNCRNSVSHIVKKLEDMGLPKNLDTQPNPFHTHHNIVKTQDTSPDVMSTNILSFLKEFLVVLDEEMEKHINHYDEEVSQNEKSNYCPSKIADEVLNLTKNHILPNEIVKLIKGIITKIERHMNRVIMRQERGSLDKALGLEPASKEFPSSNDGLQPQSNFLNEDIHKMMLDMHGMLTQFKAVSADMLYSLKEYVGELEGQMKERTQQPKRKVNYEVHGFKPQYVGRGDGHHKSRGQKILPKADDTKETLELTSEETRCLEGISTETLGMLEGFIGTLHQELKDHISRQGKKVQKDNACTRINAKPIFKHDTILQLQETSLQEDQSTFSEDEISNKSTTPSISFGALPTNTLCSLKGFVDELHRETTSSIQPKTKNIEDSNPNFPTRSTLDKIHVSIPHRGKHEVGFISPKNNCEGVPQEQNLELHTLSTKPVSAFENLRKNLDKEICDNILWEEGEPSIEKNSIKPHILDGPSASFSEETDFGTWGKSITCNRFEKYLDAKSASFNVMFMELKIFVGKVEEELKNTIEKFKRGFKQENGGMRSKMNNIEVHEFFSQTDKSELHSHSLIEIFKVWSIQIEKSIEDLLQHFKSKLMEEMNILQQKKVNDPSSLRSISCHEFQSPKSEHLTQVQTLVAEEKHAWYDILNDAAKQWLQKEWVERLEHQSELTTTCDHSTSPPSSEHLTQVHKVFGAEKNIMFDILNHPTHKWVVQQRDPLQLGSKRTSHGKEGIEVSLVSHKGHSEDGQSPPLTSKVKCCHINEELDIKKNGSRKRSHTGDIQHGDEDGQSKLFTHGSEVVECHPHNFDRCPNQAKSAQEGGNIFSHEYEELQEYEEEKLPHKNSIPKNNLSSISQWIPKSRALNDANGLHFSQDGEICEDYHKQNIISQENIFPPLRASCKDPSFKCKANNRQPCGLFASKFDKNLKLYSDGNLFEYTNTREAQGIYDKIRVPRSINQLKLVSRKGWQTLRSKLKVANAKRQAHIIVSWTFQQIACGFLPRIDTSYPAYTIILKFIKTTMGKMACGETHQSPNIVETFQADTGKDYDAENNLLDGSKMNIMHISPCNPLMKPHLTRSGQLKLESMDKENPSTQDGDVICNSTEWKKLDYSPKINDRNEFQWKNYEEIHKVESITDSFAKFQCDNDLEMSIVENTQCDCETLVMHGVNSKEVDMHELEEAINNLRKSKEIDAKGMAFKIDHYPLIDKDFEDKTSHPPNTKTTPFQQGENICAENLDLTNGILVDDHALCNVKKHQENGTNGSLKGKIPNFITFEFLQQGEIAFPKSEELKAL